MTNYLEALVAAHRDGDLVALKDSSEGAHESGGEHRARSWQSELIDDEAREAPAVLVLGLDALQHHLEGRRRVGED